MINPVLISAILLMSDAASVPDPEYKVVQTTQGPVKGYKSPDGVFEFYGIPYATAPVGAMKFQEPLPPPQWQNTLEAVNKSIICIQYNNPAEFAWMGSMSMVEDCLVANVFIPDTDIKNLSVVVYIHGGGFQVGHGNMYSPVPMVQQGKIIAVTFNYRLGVIGFLSLGTDDIPGNAGLKDQQALLKWVQKNIASFGGNPNEVTLQGYGAGAAAAELHMLSQGSKHLFQRVIQESGSSLAPWSVQIDPLKNAKVYAVHQGFLMPDNINALEEFYQDLGVDTFTTKSFWYRHNSTFLFEPCVEVETDSNRNPFIFGAPIETFRIRFSDIKPLLIGMSNIEGAFRLDVFSKWKYRMNKNFKDFLPANLENVDENGTTLIRNFYFGNQSVSEDNKIGYVNYFTDIWAAYPISQSVKYHVEAGNEAVFLYEYSLIDDVKMTENAYNPFPNFGHLDHYSHMVAFTEYKQSIGFIKPKNEDKQKLKKLIRQIWINFIQTGKPLLKKKSMFPDGWPPSCENASPYMSLTVPPQLKYFWLPDRLRFWEGIYQKYSRTPIAAYIKEVVTTPLEDEYYEIPKRGKYSSSSL